VSTALQRYHCKAEDTLFPCDARRSERRGVPRPGAPSRRTLSCAGTRSKPRTLSCGDAEQTGGRPCPAPRQGGSDCTPFPCHRPFSVTVQGRPRTIWRHAWAGSAGVDGVLDGQKHVCAGRLAVQQHERRENLKNQSSKNNSCRQSSPDTFHPTYPFSSPRTRPPCRTDADFANLFSRLLLLFITVVYIYS